MENKVNAIFEGLNSEQRKAVACVEGPVLIVAGAGSGKTRVLTCRIANILDHGCDPERIMALTFTKKAAGEMKERIAAMVGERRARRLVMGTFHSIFIRFLREYSGLLGYPSAFTIYDASDSVSAVKACIKDLGLDDKVYKPREVLARISMAKNNLVTAEAYRANPTLVMNDTHAKKPKICDIFTMYAQRCKASGVMDFDDILLNMNILLRDSREALEDIASRFSYILVDEYQDTNMAQYLILNRLAQFHRNICVVGDDSQSIYAFRGARIENILSFRKDYPECKVFRLERNYRSTKVIVEAANSLISKNENRIPKECYAVGEDGEKIRLIRSYTEQEEAVLITSAIMDRMREERAEYQDFAILYRTNSQSRALEEALRRRNIPYMIYSGNSFFERAEIKDMMAYFKLVVNPNDDESFKRAVNKPPRGIGDTSMEALGAAARAHGVSLFRAAYAPDLLEHGLRNAAIVKIRAFCDMIGALASRAMTMDALDLARKVADDSGLYAYFKADTSVEGMSRTSNVEELVNSVAQFVEDRHAEFFAELEAATSVGGTALGNRATLGIVTDDAGERRGTLVSLPKREEEKGGTSLTGGDPSLLGGGPAKQDVSEGSAPDDEPPVVTLGEFLENISLLSSVDVVTEEDTNNKVALMTAHSAKGLEFPYVYIAGMEENLFPSGGMLASASDIEEERRLFYVAVTRAKKAVGISFATTRMRNGRHESNAPSRFIREINPKYIANPLNDRDFRSVQDDDDDDFSGFGSHFFGRGGSFGRADSYGRGGREAGPRGSSYGRSSGVTFFKQERRPAEKPATAAPARHPVVPAAPAPRYDDSTFVPSPMRDFSIGQRIEHNRFGPGRILDITGTFPELKAKIAFDDYAEPKTILLKYAKMRPEQK
ncbi:MAG: UvrD-helicase domain-containing protein [Bacteroidales bacterium]|nr:UvrD-helicase domain-containing protein [Bacteroidales bacterium]